jgi:hypothetical protein
MARTAVELPDPLENASGGAANSADDLLAQLAGDEVDRLLSEADAGEPAPRNVDRPVTDEAVAAGVVAAAGEASPAPADVAAESPAGDLFDEIDLAKMAGARAPKAEVEAAATLEATQSVEDSIALRAEELIAQARLEGDDPEPTPAVPPLSAADALAAEMEADEQAHAAALQRMKGDYTPAPRAEVSVATPVPAPAAEIDEAAVDLTAPESEADDERVPLLVRVLEWINSPMTGLSPGVREAMGKVALVTAVNAIAVFLYVLIARRH